MSTNQPATSGDPDANGPSARFLPSFRVAVAQIEPSLGDTSANLALHRKQIEAARAAGADLVVFPELSLTGYELRDHVCDVAERRDGPSLRAVAAAAGELAVVVGFVEEDRAAGFYNASAFVDRGRVEHVHRKVYLPTYGMFEESRYFASGARVRGFETRFGRIGILVCEDAWHLSTAVILQADAIDLLIIVSNSPGRGVGGEELGSRVSWDHLIRTYAMFLRVPVVFANRVGYEEGVNFWGGSVILDAAGCVVAVAPELEPALIVGEVDPLLTRRQRILAPLGRDERLHLTLRELKRIDDERMRHDG